jgi:hypothetical protein
MSDTITRRMRALRDWEIEQACPAFGNTLNYEKVRVCEGYAWPDYANRFGRFTRHQAPPGPGEHNAITLGNHCYFPIPLSEQPPSADHPDYSDMQWLIHEMTHSWQYQHTGIGYLFRALWAQIRLKDKAYDFGDVQGLVKARQKGLTLFSFNPEAQASIVETYYEHKFREWDVSAFLPYIEDLQKAA